MTFMSLVVPYHTVLSRLAAKDCRSTSLKRHWLLPTEDHVQELPRLQHIYCSAHTQVFPRLTSWKLVLQRHRVILRSGTRVASVLFTRTAVSHSQALHLMHSQATLSQSTARNLPARKASFLLQGDYSSHTRLVDQSGTAPSISSKKLLTLIISERLSLTYTCTRTQMTGHNVESSRISTLKYTVHTSMHASSTYTETNTVTNRMQPSLVQIRTLARTHKQTCTHIHRHLACALLTKRLTQINARLQTSCFYTANIYTESHTYTISRSPHTLTSLLHTREVIVLLTTQKVDDFPHRNTASPIKNRCSTCISVENTQNHGIFSSKEFWSQCFDSKSLLLPLHRKLAAEPNFASSLLVQTSGTSDSCITVAQLLELLWYSHTMPSDQDSHYSQHRIARLDSFLSHMNLDHGTEFPLGNTLLGMKLCPQIVETVDLARMHKSEASKYVLQQLVIFHPAGFLRSLSSVQLET